MPQYLVEQHLARRLKLPSDAVVVDDDLRVAEDIPSLFADYFGHGQGKVRRFYLYEAPSSDSLTSAAREAGLPEDAVMEFEV